VPPAAAKRFCRREPLPETDEIHDYMRADDRPKIPELQVEGARNKPEYQRGHDIV
jgi:hypothetical protein